MLKLKFYIISIVILFLIVHLVSWAKESPSEFLPKTKDTISGSKKSSDKGSKSLSSDKNVDDKNDSDDSGDSDEEELEKISDPSESFKLIAIYLVENKPRALIKNLEKPEDSAKEYQLGDYLDELQTFSISKILLIPTARIELTDLNGLSYVLKPKNTDNSTNTQSPKTSKTTPSYGYKTKIKKSPTSAIKPDEKKEENTSLESAVKNDVASPSIPSAPSAPEQIPSTTTTITPPPEQTQPAAALQDTTSAAAQATSNTTSSSGTDTQTSTGKVNFFGIGVGAGSSSGSSPDIKRPSNPFGE